MTFDPTVYPRTLPDTVRYFVRSPQPLTLLVAAVVATAAKVAVGGWSGWDLLVVGLMLAWWPVQEWLIHVHVLHFKPRRLKSGKKIDLYLGYQHRQHHRDPLRLEMVFIPWPAIVGGLIFHAVVWPLLLPLPVALTVIAAYTTLTLHYDWVHYICHTPYTPRSVFYKRLWRNHRLHHFKNEHYWMGVSMLSGDRLFGTDPAKDDVETSKTCRTLGVEDTLGREEVPLDRAA